MAGGAEEAEEVGERPEGRRPACRPPETSALAAVRDEGADQEGWRTQNESQECPCLFYDGRERAPAPAHAAAFHLTS